MKLKITTIGNSAGVILPKELLAREANVVVEDAAFATDLRQRLVHAMQHAGRRMDPARYAGRPLRQRALDRVAFGLMRLALWITGNRY